MGIRLMSRPDPMELALETALGGPYRLSDGRVFWMDRLAVLEILRRLNAFKRTTKGVDGPPNSDPGTDTLSAQLAQVTKERDEAWTKVRQAAIDYEDANDHCGRLDQQITEQDNQIEALSAENARLREALQGMLRATDFDDCEPWIVNAHAALAGERKETGSEE